MIEKELISFLVTTVFSFLIGLEVKTYREHFKSSFEFGSIRTFTFVGILGYLFYKINIYFYIAGFIVLGLYSLLFYYFKLINQKASIVIFLVMSIVYAFGPISINEPVWLLGLIFVILIFGLNIKRFYPTISQKIDTYELETFAKMVLLSVVILPLLPKKPLPYIELSPFKIWLIVVIISAISYIGYILQKYIFSNKGYFLTGLAGGAYSSTATTVVLAGKAVNECLNSITAGIISATGVMYIRLIIVAYIFNKNVGEKLLIPYIGLFLVSIIISLFYLKKDLTIQKSSYIDENPLELKTAFIFAFLFILMIGITKFIHLHYGNVGLEVLSFIVGFTDIDPFVLSILTGKIAITIATAAKLIFIATASNNFLKAGYSYFFSKKRCIISTVWLLILGLATLSLAFI
jgi:uncharacterized membrane protein (DUF4010 family)